jgi:hypothetical protein
MMARAADPQTLPTGQPARRGDDLAPQFAPQDQKGPLPQPGEGPLTWVELSGLEPLTSCMPCKRSTN